MALIERDAALKLLDQNGVVFRREFEQLPAVDAIPVIRCEDCKHMHAVNLPDGQSWHYCPYMKFDVDPDFYCARGERR